MEIQEKFKRSQQVRTGRFKNIGLSELVKFVNKIIIQQL